MESKKRIDWRNICWILLDLAVIIFILACIFSSPIFTYLKRLEGQASWKGEIKESLWSLKISLPEGNYIHSSSHLREAKIRAEYLNMRRSQYLTMLSDLRKSIPPTTDISCLPYDLRQKDERLILYGLCSSGKLRLEGKQREDELCHLATEIKLAFQSGRWEMLSGYVFLIAKMYEVKRLTKEDIQFLETQSGVYFFDPSGRMVHTY